MPAGWGYAIGKIMEVLNTPLSYFLTDETTKRERRLEKAQKEVDQAQENLNKAARALHQIMDQISHEND